MFRGQWERTKRGGVDVVFLGDSITQGWGDVEAADSHWKRSHATLTFVNYGVGGDTTRQLLWRIDHGLFDGLTPKLVVVNIGTNNLYDDANGGTDEEIAEGVAAAVARVRSTAPGAKVLLLGVFPRQNDYFCSRIDRVNARSSQLDDGEAVRYLDLTPTFELTHGKVRPELYGEDQLHLSPAGYDAWAEAMRPALDAMLR